MKLLLHSNGPTSPTGYGVQVALLAARLADDGHEVAISCNHGQQAGIGSWTTPSGKKIRLYPARFTATGADIIHGHANHFFEGDPHAGWIIPLIDVWAFRNPFLAQYQIAAWTPVDHINCPPGVLSFFRDTAALPIAMSRHGERELLRNGLDAAFVPLAVDTQAFKPTPLPTINGKQVSARELFGLPESGFVVGIVAMNKGNVFDRKGFSEAMYAFGAFHREHPDSVLFLHTDKAGAEGVTLMALAADAGIPSEAIRFSDQYAYTIGFPAEMMAAAYTAMDVLLAPSHGEGFCVPLIEAQACGTPVIASAATAQTELVGPESGWLVKGQPMWDESQTCRAFCPFIPSIIDCIEAAYSADLAGMQKPAREFAMNYDADKIYADHWRPFLATLEPPKPDDDKPEMDRVAVIVPAMRAECVGPLVESFHYHRDESTTLYFVVDPDNEPLIKEITPWSGGIVQIITSDRGSTFAQKANVGYLNTTEDWIFLCGEDVEFTPGWLKSPRELSTRWDVIGTNDAAEGETKNPDVAAGRHADHWFTRRTYIDEQGASLEGPGSFCPEAYFHWWTDKEVIELAKARGVFSPCLDSHVIHLHPGYLGDEQARANDAVYMKAVEWRERDETTWRRRVPLIEQQRVVGRR